MNVDEAQGPFYDYDASGSESSDEEETQDDSAYLESILWQDIDLAAGENLGPTSPLDQLDNTISLRTVVPETSGAPPAKKARGRPRKTAPVVEAPPPPRREPTPPPQLNTEDRQAFTSRCQARKQQLQGCLAKKTLTKEDARQKTALLLEDEEDRHNCLGEWKWEEIAGERVFINEDIIFQGAKGGGMSEAAQRAKTELDLLRLFLTNTVVDNIVKQTNLYAQQERAKEGGSNGSWVPVTREDIMAFIGVAIAMGSLPKGDLREYWSTASLLETPWFGSVMSGRRFSSIQKYLHVADNTKAARTADGNLCDKLYKVRPLLDSLLTSFPQHFFPRRELSIDEQMIGTKARCSSIQHMKEKPTKCGVKVWALCDAKVHYCLKFQVYTGGTGEVGLSFRVVNELMSQYLGVGHHLYVDNFYTSPDLLAHLLSHNTLAVGMVQQEQAHMPMRIRTAVQKFEVGQTLFLSSHKMTVCRWKDKRNVFCLSTVHGNSMEVITRTKKGGHGEQEEVQKPKAICDYNTYMGGVDVYDQLLSYHPIPRRYKQWWLKLFWRLIEMAVLNSLALWKLKHPDLPREHHKQFRMSLCEQLTAGLRERDVPKQSRYRVANRLAHHGDPIYFDSRRGCTVCKGKSRTRFGCTDCGEDVRLHMNSGDGQPSCFKIYHTVAIYN